jgi:hypothetical protein
MTPDQLQALEWTSPELFEGCARDLADRGRLLGVWQTPDAENHVFVIALTAAADGRVMTWWTWHHTPASTDEARRFLVDELYPEVARRLGQLQERPMVGRLPLDEYDPTCWRLWWDPIDNEEECR